MWVHTFRFPLPNNLFSIFWYPSLIIPKLCALVSSNKQNLIIQHILIYISQYFLHWYCPKEPESVQSGFLLGQAYHIIIQTDKLTFIPSIFYAHVFQPNKVFFFRFCEAYLTFPSFLVLQCFFCSFILNVIMIPHPPYTLIKVSTFLYDLLNHL